MDGEPPQQPCISTTGLSPFILDNGDKQSRWPSYYTTFIIQYLTILVTILGHKIDTALHKTGILFLHRGTREAMQAKFGKPHHQATAKQPPKGSATHFLRSVRKRALRRAAQEETKTSDDTQEGAEEPPESSTGQAWQQVKPKRPHKKGPRTNKTEEDSDTIDTDKDEDFSKEVLEPVSYTHLTLPTIYSV